MYGARRCIFDSLACIAEIGGIRKYGGSFLGVSRFHGPGHYYGVILGFERSGDKRCFRVRIWRAFSLLLYICGWVSDLSFCLFDDEGVHGEREEDGRDTFNVRG